MMKNSVSDGCFVDMTELRIAYPEVLVRPMPVGVISEILVQSEDIFFKLPLEPCHIWLVAFVTFEIIPCRKKIFRRDY